MKVEIIYWGEIKDCSMIELRIQKEEEMESYQLYLSSDNKYLKNFENFAYNIPELIKMAYKEGKDKKELQIVKKEIL